MCRTKERVSESIGEYEGRSRGEIRRGGRRKANHLRMQGRPKQPGKRTGPRKEDGQRRDEPEGSEAGTRVRAERTDGEVPDGGGKTIGRRNGLRKERDGPKRYEAERK